MIKFLVVGENRFSAKGTNLYDVKVGSLDRDLDCVLCRESYFHGGGDLQFEVVTEEGNIPFIATFEMVEDWPSLVDIIPRTEYGNNFV